MSGRGGVTGPEVITSMEGINSVCVTCNLGGGLVGGQDEGGARTDLSTVKRLS